eukprot:755562-Hanusia_phi.AAC.3
MVSAWQAQRSKRLVKGFHHLGWRSCRATWRRPGALFAGDRVTEQERGRGGHHELKLPSGPQLL